MVEGHDVFNRVYTNFLPSKEPKYITSHPALPWHVNRSFDELTSCAMPEKNIRSRGLLLMPEICPVIYKDYLFLNLYRINHL